MAELTIYGAEDGLNRVRAMLQEIEFRELRPGEPEPKPPYVRIEHGGWVEESGQARPVLLLALVHPYNAAMSIVAQVLRTEAILHAGLRTVGARTAVSQPAEIVDFPIGKTTQKRLMSLYRMRMP